MKTLRVAGLALLVLGASAVGVLAVDLTATPAGTTPTSFHWTVQPTNLNIKSYHFDCSGGRWNATLTRGDVTVSDQGWFAPKDRLPFYHGLAASGVWTLESSTKAAADMPRYSYVVARNREEHSASFAGTPGDGYQKLINYLNGTIVGQEEKALEQKMEQTKAPATAVPQK